MKGNRRTSDFDPKGNQGKALTILSYHMSTMFKETGTHDLDCHLLVHKPEL
jgi:hypothetical protein